MYHSACPSLPASHLAPAPRRLRSLGSFTCQRAVSLIELVVSMGVMTIVAVSLISVTFLIRSTAEQAVYQNTALTLAQGYLEQLRSLDYTSLSAAATSSSNTLSLINAAGNPVTDVNGALLNTGDWAQEIVFLDVNTAGANIQPLTFRFRPTLTNMTGTAVGVEITVFFSTSYNWGVRRTYSGALRTVRSSVPTY